MTYARDTEHIEKAFIFGGMPARNGVTAATMLQSGYTGVDDVFVEDGNFLAAFADSARAQELTAELGSRYEVMLTNIKKYCVGFPIQSAIEGLLGLMAEHQLRADQVERITARLPESGARTVNDREMPDVNLQYAFAVTLLDGKLTFEAAHSFERMKDPRVLDLKKKVTLIGDPELSRARPEGQSIVQVITPRRSPVGKAGDHLQGPVGESTDQLRSRGKSPGTAGAGPWPVAHPAVDGRR